MNAHTAINADLYDRAQAAIDADFQLSIVEFRGTEAAYAAADEAFITARATFWGVLSAQTGVSFEQFKALGVSV